MSSRSQIKIHFYKAQHNLGFFKTADTGDTQSSNTQPEHLLVPNTLQNLTKNLTEVKSKLCQIFLENSSKGDLHITSLHQTFIKDVTTQLHQVHAKAKRVLQCLYKAPAAKSLCLGFSFRKPFKVTKCLDVFRTKRSGREP